MELADIRKMVAGDLWTNSTAYENTEYVVDHMGNRFMGTDSERMAKDHILGLFEAYGLENPHEETFRYVGWKRGPCKVEMRAPIRRGRRWIMASGFPACANRSVSPHAF